MKRFIISILILLLLASFSLVPTFAGINQISELLTVQKELVNPDSEDTTTAKTNYVAKLNKLGMAGRPESDNAAPYYQKAIELYIDKPKDLKVSTRSWPKEQPAQQQTMLKKWVQDNNRALEQIQLGSQKPYCWFKYTGQTLQIDMSRSTPIRELAFALQARTMLQAEDGNITGATNDILTLYKFGAHVAAGPKLLTEKMVGIAVKSLPIRAALNILDRKMLDANLMKSLEDRFKQLVTDYREPFDIRGEKIYIQEKVETDPIYRGFKPYLKNALEYYDTMAAKTPWQLHNEQTQSTTRDNPLIDLGLMAKIIEIESRIRADEQALITTLALLRYNAESDGYPGALSQLVSAGYIKELPIDPFSNKPFVYKRTRDSFTLYSFGADFDDDGGLHSKWGRGDEGGDQVFWPLERTQMAERPSGRERSFARTESPQRRATTFTRSAAQPYPIDDDEEEEYVPARPRPGRQKRTKTLHDAARDGDIDQVQLLLSKGADVNEKNRMNWTPLHMAVQYSKQEVIELLIAEGADVNAKNNRGLTPLMASIYIGQKDVVELLITNGADVNIMGGRADNALSMAKRRQQTEIIDLLLKHGAKEPVPQNLMEDRYYEEGNSSPGYEEQGTIRRGTRAFRGTRTVGQSPVQVDILADPNGIKARIKTLGLEKALEEVAGKSQNEMRQWQQKRHDNRTLLIRTVQKQFEEEIGFIRKVAVEEKAKKTTETIDTLLTGRQERLKKVSKELLTQKRELRQTQQPTRGRGRARTSGRSTGGRGRYPQRGQPYGGDTTESLYGRGSVMSGTNRYQSTRRPSEEVDIETENEINQWLQADVEDKTNLAEAVHEQIWVEISSIRSVAVKEEAKKTTAIIDGLLLYRQTRFEAFINKMEEEKQALQQSQDPRIRGRGYPQQGGRYRGRTSRGGTGVQGEPIEQQNQPRTRGRRR
ncbi:MAG: ankyrin repeat domain-containing protein [Planctomycetes bacterium]|nr:ankyrin repeat domain-containing protein [Planctomycetota bacterium]